MRCARGTHYYLAHSQYIQNTHTRRPQKNHQPTLKLTMNKYTILGALILAQIAILYYQLRTNSPLAEQSIKQN